VSFNEIDKLEQHGINAADINKLKGSGICTVMAVLMW
jgi:meiotic recombination protein DMC1